MATPKGKMPLKKTTTKAPISKGVVKPAQPAGFPIQTQKAYKKPSRVVVPKRGAK